MFIHLRLRTKQLYELFKYELSKFRNNLQLQFIFRFFCYDYYL